ncbi:hypothetical protein, partial [Nonomuraea deserti]|uniref:hypothetical protein n=1 Tax=Nonomuraea deserti TaxID=1848322 RepID=UPI0014055F62
TAPTTAARATITRDATTRGTTTRDATAQAGIAAARGGSATARAWSVGVWGRVVRRWGAAERGGFLGAAGVVPPQERRERASRGVEGYAGLCHARDPDRVRTAPGAGGALRQASTTAATRVGRSRGVGRRTEVTQPPPSSKKPTLTWVVPTSIPHNNAMLSL